MKLAVLLDFSSRDLMLDAVSMKQALSLHGAPATAELAFIVVSSSLADLARLPDSLGAPWPLDVDTKLRGYDGVLSLLGLEVLGSAAAYNDLEARCRDLGLLYFGPTGADNIALRKALPSVISIVGATKHAGKTIVAEHLYRAVQAVGLHAHIFSVERSPQQIDANDNPRSDYVRLARRGAKVSHVLRTGDLAPGLAMIPPLQLPECDVLIIDNSGASIAPYRSQFSIEVGPVPSQALALNPTISERKLRLCCGAEGEGDIAMELAASLVDSHGDLQDGAIAMLLHRCLLPSHLPSSLQQSIRALTRDENELASLLEAHKCSWIITDDYQWRRYEATGARVRHLEIEVSTLDWGQVTSALKPAKPRH